MFRFGVEERSWLSTKTTAACSTRSAVCTLMGCVGNWNSAERSWDCPCHGSRFGYDGAVILGSANEDARSGLPGVEPEQSRGMLPCPGSETSCYEHESCTTGPGRAPHHGGGAAGA